MATPYEYSMRFKNFSKAVITDDFLNEIGIDSAEKIRIRTRLGKGMTEQKGKPSSLAKLSESYVNYRTKYTNLFDETTPKKSNLTLTGAMLNAITYKILPSVNTVVIFFKDDFSAQKASWAHQGSANRPKREFFFIGLTLYNDIRRRFKTRVDEYLLRGFTK